MNNKQKETFNNGLKQITAESKKREQEFKDRIVYERGYRGALDVASQLFTQVADLKEEEPAKKGKKQ